MDEKLAEDAKPYYQYALFGALETLGDQFISIGDVISHFYKYISPLRAPDQATHNIFLHLAIRKFIADGVVDNVSDAFSPPFIKLTKQSRENGFANAISDKCEKLQGAQHEWLVSAFNAIAERFNYNELVGYYTKQLAELESASSSLSPNNTVPNLGNEISSDFDDKWEPIRINRDSPEYVQAVEATEAALREIESSNGYASSDPEERNAIVATVKGTLNATKEGSPSKRAIIAGLIRPLEYVAKKFSEVTIGEIAKIAVAKLLAFVSSLM